MAATPATPRATLLTAEQSSLTAARSSVQSEVLTRISIYLTFVSAGLVSLALVGNATAFGDQFAQFAIVVLAIEVIVGLLTQVRVTNAGLEDLMYVLAMNRIRAGFVELDPGMEPYLMSSAADDLAGSVRTYFFLGRRSELSHVGGSTMVFISVVTGTLAGLLFAAIATATGASIGFAITVGAIGGLAWVATSALVGGRLYRKVWTSHRPLHPSSE